MIKIIINLPKRIERLKRSIENINAFFKSEVDLVVSAGVVMENTTHGVREAHKNAVRIAKNNGEKMALIFEDDIIFRGDALDYFNELVKNLPEDFEIVLFGVYSGKIERTESKYFDRIGKFSGLQMYLINETAYDKILSYNGNAPIDHWIGSNLKCYISKKHFSYQIDGYSDNAKTKTSYNLGVLNNFKEFFY